jgi:hypothetical protein
MERELLLFDSSYLFPIFGIELEYQNYELKFPQLAERYSLRYNPVSLVEAKWYVLRLSRSSKEKAAELLLGYRRGLSSIERDARLQSTKLTDEKVEALSDLLLERFSLKDYFDRLIYSTAACAEEPTALLTEDSVLHELFKKTEGTQTPRPHKIMEWKDLRRN